MQDPTTPSPTRCDLRDIGNRSPRRCFRCRPSMNLIIIHKNSHDGRGDGLLQFALANEHLARLLLDGLPGRLSSQQSGTCLPSLSRRPAFGRTLYAVPEGWMFGCDAGATPKAERQRRSTPVPANVTFYRDKVSIPSELLAQVGRERSRNSWSVISNGRFATGVNAELIEGALAGAGADVLALTVEPDFSGEREKVRLTAEGKVAGFRRVYSDWAEFAFAGPDWPCHLFIRNGVLSRLLADGALPESFSALAERCRSEGLTLRAIGVCGNVLDLATDDGLLDFCRIGLSAHRNMGPAGSGTISGNPRIVGNVLLGDRISAASDAVIIGPAVIGDGVKIEPGAIIHSSIIGPETCVPKNQLVRNCVVRGPRHDRSRSAYAPHGDPEGTSRASLGLSPLQDAYSPFRTWKRFSYARCLKRITDCIVATAVLALFAPVIPFVALAIKLTSAGPVFYKDKRQGLHGKEFNCLKFRTMITGAHEIQQKLRAVSQVDGPQFKMADDPRINTVGRFLRETYIDEIPQFVNVFLGQMSVVGPRPSPELENTLCPPWRDARLSVRPGITGLWQIFRTREPMRDFQEWIHYDVQYVRTLSLKTDLGICWQTTRKLLDNFISQF